MKEIVAVQDLKLGMFVSELDRPWLESPFLLQGFVVDDQETLEKLRQVCRFVYVDRGRSIGDQWRAESVAPLGPVAGGGERFARLGGFQVSPDRVERRKGGGDFFSLLRSLKALRQQPTRREEATPATQAPWLHRYPDPVTLPRVEGRPPSLPRRPDGMAGAGAQFSYTEIQSGKGIRPLGLEDDGLGRGTPSGMTFTEPTVTVEEEILKAVPLVDKAQNLLVQIARDVQSNLTPDLDRLRGVVAEMVLSVARNPDALLWLVRLKQTDQYSYDHSLDVAAHVMIFGRFLGLPDDAITALGMAGMLQDVGKLRLPVRLLQKTGPLTPIEYEFFKTHVDYSLRILSGAPMITQQVLEIVARHHERCDGSGYPVGLRGEEVGLLAEISGVSDVYCAMTRGRPYGEAASSQVALEAVRAQRGTGFSESTVDQFVQCIGIYPVGTLVELNSGEVAVVVAQNRIRRLKPRVMILLGPDKKPNVYPQTLDLIYDPPNATGETYAIVKALPPGAYGVEPSEFYLA
ncbi:HD-GYP domain-containing protein [Zoogloea sp.]|uniref:HD-GYP domain-containing protein n=1 Tax=Zoogloea sp. TaxID=49181 RepID=UPI0035B00B7D